MTTPTVTETRRNGNTVGERIELGRYRPRLGRSDVCTGQRISTVVRVTDVPANGEGRAYLVERGLEHDGCAALLALIRDYIGQADQLGVPPMATTPVEIPYTDPSDEPAR